MQKIETMSSENAENLEFVNLQVVPCKFKAFLLKRLPFNLAWE